MQLGRIPKEGEHFQYQDIRYEVMDMDGNRVVISIRVLDNDSFQIINSRENLRCFEVK